jgi:hypothetical protein
MNYNHFTINYIELLKKHLKIEIFENQVLFFPDYVIDEDIVNLKKDLSGIWKDSNSAIKILQESYESKIQTGIFGLIDDFEIVLKTGYLLGDRVVAIDYIFERIIKNKEPNQIDKILLGKAASNLVLALELAKKGRFVIIPSPFYWNPASKKLIKKVAKKTIVSPQLMSLLNILSITKECKLQPYTLAESDDSFKRIIDNQIDKTMIIGKDAGTLAYEGILGGLLTEKLLNQDEFKVALNKPLSEYYATINEQNDFYTEYLKAITTGGSLKGGRNIDEIRIKLRQAIEKRNKKIVKSTVKTIGNIGGASGGAIALLSTFTAITTPIGILGGILGLVPALTTFMKDDNDNQSSVITVFKNLNCE